MPPGKSWTERVSAAREDRGEGLRPSAREREIAAASAFGSSHPTYGKKRAAFVVNTDAYFLTHRATWAVALQSAGWAVSVHAHDSGRGQTIAGLGLKFRPLRLGRENVEVVRDTLSALRLTVRLLVSRPHVVFLVASRAAVYGSLAARVMPQTRFIVIVGGAGRMMTPGALSRGKKGFALRILRNLGALCNSRWLYQTLEDQREYLGLGIGSPERSSVVRGSGVDVAAYQSPGHSESQVVLFGSRLFAEKGLEDLIDAARLLTADGVSFKLRVVGRLETELSSGFSKEQIADWVADGVLEYGGEATDMRDEFATCAVFVLPTYHREGIPRALLEAAASGCAIVTTDIPGCSDVVVDGVSGILVPPRQPQHLAEGIKRVLTDRDLASRLGNNARQRVEELFSLDQVLDDVFRLT